MTTERTTCPDEGTLSGFLLRRLPEDAANVVEAHVDCCELCREVVAELARSDEPVVPDRVLGRDDRIGRYQLESVLGAGGMGIVFAARDPELGRRVAIKLLRSFDDESRAGASRARLVREAKAMAALAHPNVVAIYDVGEHDGEVYLAMELVSGQTLRAWLSGGRRPWREVLPVLLQVGRGLAAAHALGIVHRDCKPDNIFVGEDGRVRVGDFGLAAGATFTGAKPAARDAVETQTATGAIMGTPGYMAPEQLAGGAADARSDQFSFCVTFHEALYGAPPYRATTVAELRERFARKEDAVPPRDGDVPPWLARIVARGLRIDPAARFPSMDAMLEALARHAGRRARRGVMAVVAGALAVSTSVAYLAGTGRSPGGPKPCEGGRAALDRAFGADVKTRLRAAFDASPQEYVRRLGDGVMARLETFSRAWLEAHAQACEATMVRGEQSPELMDLRMACLGERLQEVSTLARELPSAGEKGLPRAMQAVDGFAPLARCSDERALRARGRLAVDPRVRPAVDAIQAQIVTAKVVMSLGSLQRALALSGAAVADAEKIQDKAIEAAARFRLGLVLIELNRGADATRELHAAAAAADASHADEIAANAKTQLVFSIGTREAKLDESERMVPYAAAAIERIGGSPLLEANLLWYRAAALETAERPAEALPLLQQALKILRGTPDGTELRIAKLEMLIGNQLGDLGQQAESLRYYDRALASSERLLGRQHPLVAGTLFNRSINLSRLGRYEEAFADLRRALAIREEIYGQEHADVAETLFRLAGVDQLVGRLEEAQALRRRAEAIDEKTLPDHHPYRITGRLDVLDGLLALGLDAEARKLCDASLPIERKERPGRPYTGQLMAGCAAVFLRTGREREADALYRAAEPLVATVPEGRDFLVPYAEALAARGMPRRALPIVQVALEAKLKAMGAAHHLTARHEVSLARIRLQLGQRAEAIALLEDAVRALDAIPLVDDERKRAHAELERARR